MGRRPGLVGVLRVGLLVGLIRVTGGEHALDHLSRTIVPGSPTGVLDTVASFGSGLGW